MSETPRGRPGRSRDLREAFDLDDEEAERRFNLVWAVGAAKGLCDELGSVEHTRIRRTWFQWGCPWPIYQWIGIHANAGPEGGEG